MLLNPDISRTDPGDHSLPILTPSLLVAFGERMAVFLPTDSLLVSFTAAFYPSASYLNAPALSSFSWLQAQPLSSPASRHSIPHVCGKLPNLHLAQMQIFFSTKLRVSLQSVCLLITSTQMSNRHLTLNKPMNFCSSPQTLLPI